MFLRELRERKGLKMDVYTSATWLLFPRTFINDGERFFEKLPCLLNRQKTGFYTFKRGESNPAKPITNLC